MKSLKRLSLPALLSVLLLQLPGGLWSALGQTQWGMGTYHAVKGVGLALEWSRMEDLGRMGLTLDFSGVLTGKTRRPGLRASYQRLFLSPLGQFRDGSRLSLYYGPGLGLGAVRDHDDHRGLMACLSGSVGMHFLFPESPLTVSAGLSAELGLHAEKVEGAGNRIIRFYQNGIRRAWMPEIQLIYHF